MENRFETFTVLISKISRNIRKIKNQEMVNYDLRSHHISCLYYLYRNESLTVTELSERCEEDKATISRAIDYLEKNDYLTCETEIGRRYKSPLTLTEKGRGIGKRIADKIDWVLDEVSRDLSEEDRIALYRNLNMISDNLEQIEKSTVAQPDGIPETGTH